MGRLLEKTPQTLYCQPAGAALRYLGPNCSAKRLEYWGFKGRDHMLISLSAVAGEALSQQTV